MKSITDLLNQSTREIFFRGRRTLNQVSETIAEPKVFIQMFTCIHDCCFELLYSAGKCCSKKGDNRQENINPFSLSVEIVDSNRAQSIMHEMTNGWKKFAFGLDAIKIPFYCYDEINRQVVYQQNILVVMHLAIIAGMYCEQGCIVNVPHGDELFYRIQGLRSKCNKELQNSFVI